MGFRQRTSCWHLQGPRQHVSDRCRMVCTLLWAGLTSSGLVQGGSICNAGTPRMPDFAQASPARTARRVLQQGSARQKYRQACPDQPVAAGPLLPELPPTLLVSLDALHCMCWSTQLGFQINTGR